jgi:hypothetical protein
MRSSTVKVHMKTHESDSRAKSHKSKTVSDIASDYQDETKIRIPIEEEKVASKSMNLSNKMAYAVPYQKLHPNEGHPTSEHKPIHQGFHKPAYSIIATITSSVDNVFDAACKEASQRYSSMTPQRRVDTNIPPPIMNLDKGSPGNQKGSKSSTEKDDSHYSNTHIILPNLNQVNLEGCLLNKQSSNFVERAQCAKSMALNLLVTKLMETDPLT